MVTRIVESDDKLYLRYHVKTAPYKDGFTKIIVLDNYFDKGDYAFVNLETGEIKSYNDVALRYVQGVLKRAGMSMYDVTPNMQYKFYTKPHSSEVVNTETIALESSQAPKAEVLLVTGKDLKKLGHDVDDFVNERGQHLVSTVVCYHIGKCGDVYSALVGYETADNIFGYYDTESGFSRHSIPKAVMKSNLIIDAEMRYEDTHSALKESSARVVENKKVDTASVLAELDYVSGSLQQTLKLYTQDVEDALKRLQHIRTEVISLKNSEEVALVKSVELADFCHETKGLSHKMEEDVEFIKSEAVDLRDAMLNTIKLTMAQ